MKTYLALYGNGTRRLFDAFSKNEASAMANNYGRQHGCGMLCNVTLY